MYGAVAISQCSTKKSGLIKVTLLCAHGPTVLTNPEPYSADFLSACVALSRIIATGHIQDAYPCPHVMT